MYIPVNIRLVKVNYDDILSAVDNSRKIRVEAREIAISSVEKKVEEAKQELLNEVENHYITKELQNGEEEGSELVGGGASLFAYVGFYKGSTPHKNIVPFLDMSIRVLRNSVRKGQGKLYWQIPIQVPEPSDFDVASLDDAEGCIAEIPWMKRSFVSQIEEGIPGMANFLYFKRPIQDENNRSKHGIQNSKDVSNRLSSVDNVKGRYLTPILEKFIKDVK